MSSSSSSKDLFKNLPNAPAGSAEDAPEVPAVETQGADSDTDDLPPPVITELGMLKQRAQLMGITFSNNISAEKLKERIAAKLAGENKETEVAQPATPSPMTDLMPEQAEDETVDSSENPPKTTTAAPTPVKSKAKTIREQLLETEMALVRLRITNMDPKKKDLPGEIFTVANEYIGTVKKYIPYGEATDNGYHVPMVIYRQLLERTFVSVKVRKVGGREVIEQHDVREFALEILPQLTPAELARLAASQAAGDAS